MAEHAHKEGEEHEHETPKEEELPEFNDEFVRALGPFKDLEDFKTKLKANIKLEKENQAKEKTRLKIIEQVIDDSTMETPDLLIDVELDKIVTASIRAEGETKGTRLFKLQSILDFLETQILTSDVGEDA